MGRKSKADEWLTADGLLLLEGWARDGATNEVLAKKMGIHVSTFCDWMNKYPELPKAIKKGRAPIDFEVENALLKLALGHDYEVEEPVKVKVKKQLAGKGTIETEEIQMVKKTVHAPPNLGALAFWMKNRVYFENGKHKYSDNPASDEIRLRELELKEKQAAQAINNNEEIKIIIDWGLNDDKSEDTNKES